MIKIKEDLKITIDLTGSEGNAFCILAHAKSYADQLDLNYEIIRKEMIKGNYENLITVFDNYFGEYVDLLR